MCRLGDRIRNLAALGRFASEWTKAVQRDFNHPSIVVWCPLNEVWENLEDSERVRDVRFVEKIYKLTKTLDSNRPCVVRAAVITADITIFSIFTAIMAPKHSRSTFAHSKRGRY